ncbi:hypothetical protein V511_14040 [Mesotoga sp. Brook.08.YT.4.2.5.1]|nr:hypothetical protein V511_14040 [Mesotoga sp. Brook.08.YT.4.2.5.1]PNS41259.1 hypothetical protein RJ60_05585 [Mesotoga sp. B105.6.4]PVD16969.1 hypothetical protein V512_008570 [Mesotoga sp. Brook.08.105.5.1]RAO95548.1 hypothetical protein M388_05975 [Mesotoga sp. Brook.08.YT.4.2.5.4.]RDI93466.1 hypothetical protein Q502_05730 [Mesotoga sp. Brook.08.YT.4.2.5.2.]
MVFLEAKLHLRLKASSRSKIRCMLKNKDSLSAVQNNVVRQRSTVHREDRFKRLREFLGSCSTTRNLSLATVSKNEILARSASG